VENSVCVFVEQGVLQAQAEEMVTSVEIKGLQYHTRKPKPAGVVLLRLIVLAVVGANA
jgi:hypothetical protein